MSPIRWLSVVTATAMVMSAARGGTFYVDADNCPGPGDGTVGNPFCSIQIAIGAAGNGDEIIVAPGTYNESLFVPTYDTILRSSDGPEVTIIDASGFNDTVVRFFHSNPGTILEGFTITGGTGFDEQFGGRFGGGTYLQAADPTIIDCVFTGNTALHGGALYGEFSDVTLIGCAFIANAGGTGGAVRLDYGESVLDRCTIIGNDGDLCGGAVYGFEAEITATDCILSGNTTDCGGAITAEDSDVTLNRCRLTGNFATSVGGAVLDTNHGFFTLVNCVVSYNTSNQGGGVHVGSAFLTSLVNCTFVGNSGYGLFVDNNAGDVSMSNGILWGNTPGPVGGPGTQPTIAYSDVEGGWPGPGINNIDTDPQLVADVIGTWTSDPVYDAASDRTVLTDSNASFDVDGLVGQAMIPDTSLGSLQTVVLTNTATTITLIGEVWSAVVIAGEDYAIRSDRITPDSPCIDAGRNNAVPFGV
ncbi:MAG: right-handed parallel beta-helix repeat-containing protein, partial [Planctomycetota bacterium]